MKVQLRRWSVPAGVIDLKTRRAPEELDFFVSPPPEIGRVKSVVWDVRAGQALWALWFKILLASLVTVLALTALLWLRSQKKLGEKAGLPEVMLLGIALGAPVVAIGFALQRKFLAYIGEQGTAVFHTRGSRNQTKLDLVVFAEVTDIENKQVGGRKGTTEWRMTCFAANKKRLLSLRYLSRVIGGKNIPMRPTPFLICLATYAGWKGAPMEKLTLK